MEQHRSGKGAKFTRGFGFEKLLYQESYLTKSKALKREAQIKSWPRSKKEALINRNKSEKLRLDPNQGSVKN